MPVGIVLAIVKQCAYRLIGNHVGLAWTHLVGVTLVYCGTMRMLNASVGTLDGCVRQSLWTSVVELASRVMFKCREVALLRVMVRVCGSWRDSSHFAGFTALVQGIKGMTLATMRLTPKQLRFQADYVVAHNLIEQIMIIEIALVNAVARVQLGQSVRDAVGQAFSLAIIQLALEFVTNCAAMYYESWAGVPVVEVWVQHRCRFSACLMIFVAFT